MSNRGQDLIRDSDLTGFRRNGGQGAESNHRHADFQSTGSPGNSLFIKKLPGRQLPDLHHDAQPCTSHSRKAHAVDQ